MLLSMLYSFKPHPARHPLPHPAAPDKPPLNIAANMLTAPLEKAADLVRFGGAPPM